MENMLYSLSTVRAMQAIDAAKWLGTPASAFWLEWDHMNERSIPFMKTIDWLQQEHWPKLIKPGATCIDIGAHSGDTAVPIGLFSYDQKTGKKGNVFAVEPNPDLYPVLEACFAINSHISNFELIKAAITAVDIDEIELADHANKNCNGGIIADYSPGLTKLLKERRVHTYKARGLSLETLIRFIESKTGTTAVDFIKIDCEGYDKEIIKGGAGILRQLKPTLFIEWFAWFEEADDDDLFSTIESIDYVPLHPLSLVPMSKNSERTSDLTCIHRSKLHALTGR